MRTELGKKYGERDFFYGTFEKFGRKSGYKQFESTVCLIDIEDQDGNTLTDHLWFNYTKEFESLYKAGKLKAGAILEFRARVAGYMKGYEKEEFDYKLSFPKKISQIGWDPSWINEVTDEPIPIPEKKKTGTEELGDKNVNIEKGCRNGCLYCYAYSMRHHYDKMEMEDWIKPTLLKEHKSYRKSDKTFFFASSHDIVRENVDRCKTEILKILSPGNNLTIVTKADPECIKKLIPEISQYMEQIEFYITITTMDEDLRLKWEPFAPSICNRLTAVHMLLNAGFKTNILCEPMLSNPDELIEYLLMNEPNIHKIWLGAMQYRSDAPKLDFNSIYKNYRDNPKFAFKDSFMKKIKDPLKPDLPIEMDQAEFNRLMIDWLENGYEYEPYTDSSGHIKSGLKVKRMWFDSDKGIKYEGQLPKFFLKFESLSKFKIIQSNPQTHMIRFEPKTIKEAICILKGIPYEPVQKLLAPTENKIENSIPNDPMKRNPKMKNLLSFMTGGSN